MKCFIDMLLAKFGESKFVCVGLDSDLERMPRCIESKAVSRRIAAFNQAIVDATD